MTARDEPELTSLQTLEVAMKVPSVAALFSEDCPPLLSADHGTARRRFVTAEKSCEQLPRDARLVAEVDVRTGSVTDPRTQKVLDSPESIALAQAMLAATRQRKAAAAADIERSCQAK